VRQEASAARAGVDAALAARPEEGVLREALAAKADGSALRAVQHELARASAEALAAQARFRQRAEEVGASVEELRAAHAAQQQRQEASELARRHAERRADELTAAVASKAERAHTDAALAERPTHDELAARLAALDGELVSRAGAAAASAREELSGACAKLDGGCAQLDARLSLEASRLGARLDALAEEQAALAVDAHGACDDVCYVAALVNELHHALTGVRHAGDAVGRQVAAHEAWRVEQEAQARAAPSRDDLAQLRAAVAELAGAHASLRRELSATVQPVSAAVAEHARALQRGEQRAGARRVRAPVPGVPPLTRC
jgi:hypothetical protein